MFMWNFSLQFLFLRCDVNFSYVDFCVDWRRVKRWIGTSCRSFCSVTWIWTRRSGTSSFSAPSWTWRPPCASHRRFLRWISGRRRVFELLGSEGRCEGRQGKQSPWNLGRPKFPVLRGFTLLVGIRKLRKNFHFFWFVNAECRTVKLFFYSEKKKNC